jgi:hypothetical protein
VSYQNATHPLPRGGTDLMTRKQQIRTSNTLMEHYRILAVVKVKSWPILVIADCRLTVVPDCSTSETQVRRKEIKDALSGAVVSQGTAKLT